MAKKTNKATETLAPELGSTLALHLSGEHLGDGWVQLDMAHPLVAMYFYGGLVQLTAPELPPAHAKVMLAFQPTKTAYRLTDWKVLR